MEMDRRHFLDLLGSGILLSAAPSTVSGPKAALLLPITGASAELGLSMQRATRLAQSGSDEKTAFPLFDTSDTSEGAAKAAAAAMAAGAGIILGPVFGRQIQAVSAAAAGRVPIVSFSNSNAAPGSGVFTFGITPSQSVSAILQYARARGVRRFSVLGTGSGWSEQGKRAAERLAPEIGLQLVDPGSSPDAALLTGDGAQFAAYAPRFGRGFRCWERSGDERSAAADRWKEPGSPLPIRPYSLVLRKATAAPEAPLPERSPRLPTTPRASCRRSARRGS